MAEAFATVVAVYNPSTGPSVNLNQSIGSVSAYIESKDLDLGKVDLNKMLQKIYMGMSGASAALNMTLTIKYRDNVDDPLQSDTPIPMTDVRENALPVRPPLAKFFRVRLDDIKIINLWRLASMEFFGQLAGRRW